MVETRVLVFSVGRISIDGTDALHSFVILGERKRILLSYQVCSAPRSRPHATPIAGNLMESGPERPTPLATYAAQSTDIVGLQVLRGVARRIDDLRARR